MARSICRRRNAHPPCSTIIWATAISRKYEDFPDLRIIGMGAAWGDYNNDGWMDLVVTGYDTIIQFRNDHGHLVREKNFPSRKGFWTGVSWGDYNRDGYLDLYVCGYVKYKPGEPGGSTSSTQFGLEVPFTLNPASYDPERNLLFRNNRERHVHRSRTGNWGRESGRTKPECSLARLRWRWLARPLRGE